MEAGTLPRQDITDELERLESAETEAIDKIRRERAADEAGALIVSTETGLKMSLGVREKSTGDLDVSESSLSLRSLRNRRVLERTRQFRGMLPRLPRSRHA